jgi:hypothetical protein
MSHQKLAFQRSVAPDFFSCLASRQGSSTVGLGLASYWFFGVHVGTDAAPPICFSSVQFRSA